MEMDLSGKLLVSSAHLWDPNFRRTVVYISEHDREGAFGFVLNDPLDLSAVGVIPEWDAALSEPRVVFRGGPVQPESAFGLAHPGGSFELQVADLEVAPGPHTSARIFAGYSGWGPGQLEDELEEGAWFVVPAGPADVLTSNPGSLWEQVASRLPGDARMLRTMPIDPSLN